MHGYRHAVITTNKQQSAVPTLLPMRAGTHPSSSRLVFPKPLSQVLDANVSYTYGPGFIQFNGANWLDARTELAAVVRVSCHPSLREQVENAPLETHPAPARDAADTTIGLPEPTGCATAPCRQQIVASLFYMSVTAAYLLQANGCAWC